MKMDAKNERFKELYEELRERRFVYSQADFARVAGRSSGQISQMLSGTAGITFKTLGHIESFFPDVNINWVMTGEGAMFKSQAPAIAISNVGNNTITESPNASIGGMGSEELAALRAENARMKEEIDWLRSQLSKI